MADPDTGAAPTPWRARLTDPAVPVLALVFGTVATIWYAPVLTWAIIGGLAGFSLSGSV